MALTTEQLDAIEAVKGKRNPALWDPRCQQYLDNKAMHYAKIVEETNNYWKSYYKDCFIAAERECLSKSGSSS